MPFGEFERESDEQVSAKIAQLVGENSVDVIVVGMPNHLSGDPSEQSKKTDVFIEVLRKVVDVKIETVPEAFTSKQASDMDYAGAGIHEKSALLILEDWISQQ